MPEEIFGNSLSYEEYNIRVVSKETNATYQVGFGRIGIEDIRMEARLKQILEVITTGNDIVGVRFGKIQKTTTNTNVGSAQLHEFILDWKVPTE